LLLNFFLKKTTTEESIGVAITVTKEDEKKRKGGTL
jgi:hypothetical protein